MMAIINDRVVMIAEVDQPSVAADMICDRAGDSSSRRSESIWPRKQITNIAGTMRNTKTSTHTRNAKLARSLPVTNIAPWRNEAIPKIELSSGTQAKATPVLAVEAR